MRGYDAWLKFISSKYDGSHDFFQSSDSFMLILPSYAFYLCGLKRLSQKRLHACSLKLVLRGEITQYDVIMHKAFVILKFYVFGAIFRHRTQLIYQKTLHSYLRDISNKKDGCYRYQACKTCRRCSCSEVWVWTFRIQNISSLN